MGIDFRDSKRGTVFRGHGQTIGPAIGALEACPLPVELTVADAGPRLTAESWKSAVNGNWGTAADWSGGTIPNSTTDATIAVAGNYTVSITNAQAAHSLTVNNASAKISDTGTLAIGTTLAVTAGTFTLGLAGAISGGTLSAGTGGKFVFTGDGSEFPDCGTLSGVTYQGILNLNQTNSGVALANGFTLAGTGGTGAGTINLTGANAFLYITDNETLTNGVLNIGSATNSDTLELYDVGQGAVTLTLAANFNVVQGGTYATIYDGPYGYEENALVNNGTITAAVSGGQFDIEDLGTFTNAGHIVISNDDVFTVGSQSFTNTGSISIATGGDLILGSTSSLSSLGSITNTGGYVDIAGTLLNTGTLSVASLAGATGTLFLDPGGSISGGTIHDPQGSLYFIGENSYDDSAGTLSGVTYQGILNLNQTYSAVAIASGFTLAGANGTGAGTINLTGYNAFLYITDNETLTNGVLNIGSATNSDTLELYDVGQGAVTLTLAANFNVVQGGTYATIYDGPYGYEENALVNNGTITAAVSGGQFDIEDLGTFTNAGHIVISNDDVFTVGSQSFTNTGSISIATGGDLILGSTSSLSSLGSITNTGGDVEIAGTLLNTGTLSVASLAGATGTLFLDPGGSISGGAIQDPQGSLYFIGGNNDYDYVVGTLSGVTYQGILNLNQYYEGVAIANGFTLAGANGTGAGTINLTGYDAFLYITDNETLANGVLNIGSTTNTDTLELYDVGQGAITLTLAANFSVVQGGTYATIYDGPYGEEENTLVNNGTITAAVADGQFAIESLGTFTNAGHIVISNDDAFTIGSQGFTNTGSISIATGGDLVLGSTSSLSSLGSITNTGGDVEIAGTLLNNGTLSVASLAGATGALSLDPGATISGGTIQDPQGSLYFESNGYSYYDYGVGTLSGVTYQGILNLNQTTAFSAVAIANGFTLAGAGGIGAGTINLTGYDAFLYITDNETLANGVLNFGNNSDVLELYDVGQGAVTLTLASNFSVVQGGIFATIDDGPDGYEEDTLVNNGTINADFAGGELTIGSLGTFTNAGTIIVSNTEIFSLSTQAFTSLRAGALSGSYQVGASSLLSLGNNEFITSLTGAVTLTGAGSTIQSYNTTTGTEVTIDTKLTTINAAGILAVLGARGLSATNAFTDNGLLQLGGGTFKETSLAIGSNGRVFGFGTITPAIADSGTVEAKSGTLLISGAITGTGTLQIDAGATLDLHSSTTAQETAIFAGQGVLKLDNPTAFASPIANFQAGDVLNIGALVATSASLSGSTLTITTSTGTTLTETLTGSFANERFGVSGSTVTAYREASASPVTPQSVAFGNHHVGDTANQSLSLTNTATADGFSETLDATIGGATAGITAGGSFTGLAAGMTNATSLSVGLTTTTAGAITATATITLSSDGAGTDGGAPLGIGIQTVNATGAVFNYAAGTLGAATLNFGNHHIGDLATQALMLTNTAPAGNYSEALDAGFLASSGAVSASGTLTGLSAGASNGTALDVTLSTAAAGAVNGGATLGLTSDGTGIDGLGTTSLASDQISAVGAVFAYAAGTLASSTINLGIHHVGDTVSQALTLTNSGPMTGGYTEALDGTLGGATTGVTATGSVNLLGVGATNNTALLVGLNTSKVGAISGTATLTLASDGTGLDSLGVTTLAPDTVTVTGTIDNYAKLQLFRVSGTTGIAVANHSTVNLGTTTVGAAALSVNLGVDNYVAGPADVLSGSFTETGSGFTNSGFNPFSNLTAMQYEHSQIVKLNTTTAGTFSETIQVMGTGSNASGYSGALATQTITVTGTIVDAGATLPTIAPSAPTLGMSFLLGSTSPTAQAPATMSAMADAIPPPSAAEFMPASVTIPQSSSGISHWISAIQPVPASSDSTRLLSGHAATESGTHWVHAPQ